MCKRALSKEDLNELKEYCHDGRVLLEDDINPDDLLSHEMILESGVCIRTREHDRVFVYQILIRGE